MGDQIGASPPSSGLLKDEPSILFTNSLGNQYCSTEERMNPRCNLVATIGNHEFDKGQNALFDLIYGTDNPPVEHWIALPHYPGATYPYISANIIDVKTQKPLFPPYIIKMLDDIPVAFIGAVLKKAADSMLPEHAKGIEFLDEAATINQYIPEIKAKGAKIIIVLIHEGGNQTPYEGQTRINTKVEGSIKEIVNELDDDIDVVMGGHTHQFINAFLPNRNGINILVTQANSYSASFAEVTLEVDPKSHKVMQKTAKIITTFANHWPGTEPDKQTQELVQLAENKVNHQINRSIGTLAHDLLRAANDDGESNLGNLVADAFRSAMNADIGLTNPHSLRDDMKSGTVTWGNVYSMLPFSNIIVTVSLTGQDLYELLEQQWMGTYDNMLHISGITYTYDSSKPLGNKISIIMHESKPLIKNKIYSVATNNFLAAGNGVFSVMKRGAITRIGQNDHEAIIEYIQKLPQPFTAAIEGRIRQEG
uniref:bifunctional metallophosphatase/5'-nucleotidase n=1 Tax=uncultured Legionella sp. TaxID=210934 RepID=UPI00262F273D